MGAYNAGRFNRVLLDLVRLLSVSLQEGVSHGDRIREVRIRFESGGRDHRGREKENLEGSSASQGGLIGFRVESCK